ncbi:MAG: TadE family protein [Candidatus Dormiibacterota bacterium]
MPNAFLRRKVGLYERAQGRAPRRLRRSQKGATIVEFALVGSIFLLVVGALLSGALYVFEVQMANDSAQAAARWAVAVTNYTVPASGTTPLPQCTAGGTTAPPAGMISAAKAAAGPFAGGLTLTTSTPNNANVSTGSNGPNGGTDQAGCTVTVSVPNILFGGWVPFGPHNITAVAVDYET